MAELNRGDICEVILDCFPVEADGQLSHRIQFRGLYRQGDRRTVFAPGAPALAAGGFRNDLNVFYGTRHDVNAFLVGQFDDRTLLPDSLRACINSYPMLNTGVAAAGGALTRETLAAVLEAMAARAGRDLARRQDMET